MSENQKTLQFEITTPERTVITEEAFRLTVPAKQGEITILPDHIPLISSLDPGIIEVKNKNEKIEIMAISGGFVEVMPDKVIILSDTAEKAAEIDIEKAEEARKKAEEEKQKRTQMDRERFAEVSAKLSKELARTKAVEKWRKIKD